MPKGSQFEVDAYQDTWAHGRSVALGQTGWAARQYLSGTYGAATETFHSAGQVGVATPSRGGAFLEGFAAIMRGEMRKRGRTSVRGVG
jgi:hypothetical protein